MATKSGQQEPEKAEVVEELLDALDTALDRVKVLYEQYFLGIQKQPPTYLHTDVERKIRDITQIQVRNTALRYRFVTLQQKFGSYNAYWRRTLRQIESGTYTRNLSKIGRQAARTGAAVPEEILAAMPKRMREQVQRDREAALALAVLRDPQRADDPDLLTLADEDVDIDLEDLEPAAFIHESSDLRRSMLTADRAHKLDEADADFDLDAFFESVTSEAEPDLEAATPVFMPRARAAQTAPRPEARPPGHPRPGSTSGSVVTALPEATRLPNPGPPSTARPPAGHPGAPPSIAPPTTAPPTTAPSPAPQLGPRAAPQMRPTPAKGAVTQALPRPPRPAPPRATPPAGWPIHLLSQSGGPPPATPNAGTPPAIPGDSPPPNLGQPPATPNPRPPPAIPNPGPPPATPNAGLPRAAPDGSPPPTPNSVKPPLPAATPARPPMPPLTQPLIPNPARPLMPAPPQATAPSQATRPNPVAAGAAAARTPSAVESLAGPFPRLPSLPALPNKRRLDTGASPVTVERGDATEPAPSAPVVGSAAPRPPVPPPLRTPEQAPPSERTVPSIERAPVPARVPPTERPPAPERASSTARAPLPGRLSSSERTPAPERVPPSERTPAPERVPPSERTPAPERVPSSERTPAPERVLSSERTPAPERASSSERTPVPERVASSERPASRQGPPPGMSDADVNALYAKYVKAKETLGEDAGPGAYGKLLKTINAQAPKIMEQYKATGVDFSVVVKDNQVIIRAKPKP